MTAGKYAPVLGPWSKYRMTDGGADYYATRIECHTDGTATVTFEQVDVVLDHELHELRAIRAGLETRGAEPEVLAAVDDGIAALTARRNGS